MPFNVLITVFLTGAFFTSLATGTGFLTIVPLLASLLSLIVLALPLPILVTGAATGGAALLPLPTPVVLAAGFFSPVTFRAAAPARVAFAFSTMFVRIPAAPPWGVGAVGLSGEMGRARKDFVGEAGRMGERGRVREFAERGERMLFCAGLRRGAREVVRAGGMGGPFRSRFLGLAISSFSLLIERASLFCISVGFLDVVGGWMVYLMRFGARWGDGLARERLCSACNRFFRGELSSFARDAAVDGPLYFRWRSPIRDRRKAIGIRLTRISIRVRKPWAWRLYCARSFLARSVTFGRLAAM